MPRKKKDDADEDPINRVAYHEAAHSVMATFLGTYPVLEVVLAPQGVPGAAGICRLGPCRVACPRTQALHMAIINMAGPAAEHIIYGDKMPQHPRSDTQKAHDCTRKIRSKPEGSDELLRAVWLQAVDLIGSPLLWPAVSAVAAMLLVRGALSGAAAEKIARMYFAHDWENVANPTKGRG
jgi:hypothetical protein